MAKDHLNEYLEAELRRLKEIMPDYFRDAAANFEATLTLPQTKKESKRLFPKEDKSPLQVIHHILKGE